MNLKIGDRVYYRGSFGGGSPKPATIVGTGTLDNGEAVVDVQPDDGSPVRWGYLHQVSAIPATEPVN